MSVWATAALITMTMATGKFEASDGKFLLNGQPYVVRSGEMHYPRVPREYWRDRMRWAKQMGLNTICTYVFWNLHEKTRGVYDFSGNLDLGRYIDIAKEEGLNVIVRPGPYICTETDLGGLPSWLLKIPDCAIRQNNPAFLAEADRYLKAVGKIVGPRSIEHGGPVIMTQVENEYGSFGADKTYLGHIRKSMEDAGFGGLFFTSDGPSKDLLAGGTLPDLPPTINFGGGAESAFKMLEAFRPGSPKMIGEYWCGWFDHWGKSHHTTSIERHVEDLKWCVKNGVSFNLYMFHGGTNWGAMQGSNGGLDDINIDTTSYDYDAPLDESGRPTEKYWAFREAITGSPKPAEFALQSAPVKAFGKFELAEMGQSDTLFVGQQRAQRPMSFEQLGLDFGVVTYRSKVILKGASTLRFDRVMDLATVYLDGKQVGVVERRLHQKSIALPKLKGTHLLEIVVEGLSRINFGGAITTERKGLLGSVWLDDQEVTEWTMTPISLEQMFARRGEIRSGGRTGAKLFAGVLQVTEPADTFIDTRGLDRGFLWVNGINLGRYWKIGPQQTLYVPGCWLKRGNNEVVIAEFGEAPANPVLKSIDHPILDEALEPERVQTPKAPISNLGLDQLQPVFSGELPNVASVFEAELPKPVEARYLCIVALDEQDGGPFSTLAEVDVVLPDGRRADKSAWRVVQCDSEEVQEENGAASNIIDQQPTTFWHSQWGSKQPKHPHYVVLDFGRSLRVKSVKLLPRQDSSHGRMKNVKIYAEKKPLGGG